MYSRGIVYVILCCGLLLQTGCSTMYSMHQATQQSLRAFRPKATDYRDPTEEEDHNWDYVGEIARGDRVREKEVDGFWGKYVMSEKARSIERNIGIDH